MTARETLGGLPASTRIRGRQPGRKADGMSGGGVPTDVRRTRAWRRLVNWAKLNLPWTCHLCGQPIPRHVHRFHPLAFALDHKLTVRDHPQFALSPDNVAPSHKRCNDWRKARPLTPGLVLECTERFTEKPALALGFFGESTPPPQNRSSDPQEGRAESTQPPGPRRPSFRPASLSDHVESPSMGIEVSGQNVPEFRNNGLA